MAQKKNAPSAQEGGNNKTATHPFVADPTTGIDSIANEGTKALDNSMQYYKDVGTKAIDALKEIAAGTEDVEIKRECVDEIKQIYNDSYVVQDKQAERIIEKEKVSFDYKSLLYLAGVFCITNPDKVASFLSSFQSAVSLDQLKSLPSNLKSAIRFKR